MTDSKICPTCGQANEARAKFCLECGTAFASPAETPRPTSERPVEGERRVVTVLFADLSGFTSYSERTDVEEVRALAHEAAERLAEIVVRYGGTVDKIIGDAVMAVFGAPVSYENDPERAVKAALDMQLYFTEHAERFERLPLSIGLNTGEAMYAPVGPGGQYTVIGDTVNTASRLQSAAARGEVLVGEPTHAATYDFIEYESVPAIKAKNKADPVKAWRAMSVKGMRARKAVGQSSLVGRNSELNHLWELWQRARAERMPYLVTVVGAPGVGKSRLITELTKRIETITSVYWGRCLDYGEGITYWPVMEIIKDAAGIVHDDESESVSEKLGNFLENLRSEDMSELRTMAVALANLVAAPKTPRGTYEATEITQAELHWGIRRVFQLLAAQEPLLLVFEDLHWAEPTLIELLEFIVEGENPILVVASSRPEIKETKPELTKPKGRRRYVEMQALSEAESEVLLTELLEGVGLPPAQVATLLEAAGGNPLFLEETVHMLGEIVESGELLAEDGKLPVPKSLRSLISSRLDRMPPLEKRLAEKASILGMIFWLGAVRYLSWNVDDDVEFGLGSLEDRDLIREQMSSSIAGEHEYAFKHALIRDVAYDRVSKGERARMHARSGEWVSALPGGEEEFVEIVAYHLEQACRLAAEVPRAGVDPPILSAVKALQHAGEKAENREGTKEADRYYSRALALVGDRFPETATELNLRRCGVRLGLGEVKSAVDELSNVSEWALRIGRLDLRCGALLRLASIDQAQGRVSEARHRLTEASSIADDLGERRLRIQSAFSSASLRGESETEVHTAIEELREALALAEDCDELDLKVEGHLRLGTILFNIGELTEAGEHFFHGASHAAELGSVRRQAGATQFLGLVKFYLGEAEEAERLTLQSQEWFERTADRYLQAQNLRALAKFALGREDFDTAERHLKDALPLSREIGGWLVVEINRYLAETLSRKGRADGASKAAAAARAALPEEDKYALAAVNIAEAFAAFASGEDARWRKPFEAGLSLIQEQGYPIDLAEARIAFGRLLMEWGDEFEARRQLDLARETFSGMAATGMVAEIERELVRVSEGAASRGPLTS